MEIIFAEKATEDLVEIIEYMSEKNLDVAKKISRQIQYTCKLLTEMPNMGMSVEVLVDTDYLNRGNGLEISHAKTFFKKIRKFSVVDFDKIIIFYQVVDKSLEVVRILHSSRDIPIIFTEMST